MGKAEIFNKPRQRDIICFAALKTQNMPLLGGVISGTEMKPIIVLLAILFAPVSSALAQEFLGTYKTDPEVFPGFVKPYPENVKKLIESMTWKMTITANGIVIEMNSPDSIDTPYQYTIEGRYLLAELAGSDVKKYVPFYMENSDTIHGFGTIFYRVE